MHPNIVSPVKWKTRMTVMRWIDWPKITLNMSTLSSRARGQSVLRSRRAGCAGSVASDNAVNVSITMLIPHSCTAVSSEVSEFDNTALKKVITMSVILTKIWNCENFLTALLMHRPYMMALRIEAHEDNV